MSRFELKFGAKFSGGQTIWRERDLHTNFVKYFRPETAAVGSLPLPSFQLFLGKKI